MMKDGEMVFQKLEKWEIWGGVATVKSTALAISQANKRSKDVDFV